jgi:hypothetical protein
MLSAPSGKLRTDGVQAVDPQMVPEPVAPLS